MCTCVTCVFTVITSYSTSDGEHPNSRDRDRDRDREREKPATAIAPVETQMAREVGGVDPTHLAQLYQLVAKQQEELAALRMEQERSFSSPQLQLETLQTSLLDSQHHSLSEQARQYRILCV